MLTDYVDATLVVDVARGVVRDVAPHEMPMFRANSELYLKAPIKSQRNTRDGDDLLGFGAGVDLTLLTPIAIAVTSEVLKFLATEIANSAKRESAPIIHQQVRRLFVRFRTAEPNTDDPPPLNKQQLEQVRAVAFETACRLQLPSDQAKLLADATVGGLAVA